MSDEINEKDKASAARARKAFYKKIVDIQANLVAKKSKYNKFGDFHYRSLEDINEAVKPLLQKHGLAMIKSDQIEEISGRFYVVATVTITDGVNEISNTARARETESRPKFDVAQLTGAASTYARKYALGGLLAIADNDGADALPPDTPGKPTKTTTRKPKTKPKQPPKPPAKEPKTTFTFDESAPNSLEKITESQAVEIKKLMMPFNDEEVSAFHDFAAKICGCEVVSAADVNNGGYAAIVRALQNKVKKKKSEAAK